MIVNIPHYTHVEYTDRLSNDSSLALCLRFLFFIPSPLIDCVKDTFAVRCGGDARSFSGELVFFLSKLDIPRKGIGLRARDGRFGGSVFE